MTPLAALGLLAPPAPIQEAAPSPAPEQVHVVATFVAKPGKEAALRAKLLKMIAPTRNEAGCLSYDLHVNPASPAQFVFIENWKNEAVLMAHMKTPHFARLITNGTPALLAAPYVVGQGRILSRFNPRDLADPRLSRPSALTLLAIFPVQPDKLAAILPPTTAMVMPTRAERGNISYDLYQSRTGANVLYYSENWESKAALDAHMRTPHFVRHIDRAAAPKLAAPFVILTLKRLSPPGLGRGAR